MSEWLEIISGNVWGWPLIILLTGTHLFLTFRLGFIQKHILSAIRISFTRSTQHEGAGEISHFGALTTALAATIGAGNIIGVAAAICTGGPGAVLWMWLTGVFGIATKYGEAILALKYRIVRQDGTVAGGPMYALEHGLKMRWLGVAFALLTAVAAFGIGNMFQANAVASTLQSTWGVKPWISGAALTVLTALVILGGIRSIARFCEFLVPFMAVFYVGGCLVLLAIGWRTIPATLQLILVSAFTGKAAIGGAVGFGVKLAIQKGIARGLFSNESGLGSAPIVAAAAKSPNPVRQALVSSTGTFWDTVVICLITGVTLVNSHVPIGAMDKESYTNAVFATLPGVGPIILSVGLMTFVFSTILGWSYYGEKAIEYLFGRWPILPYRILWVAAVMVGALMPLKAVINFSDIANGLMAVPNLIALILLSPVIVAETKLHLPGELSCRKDPS